MKRIKQIIKYGWNHSLMAQKDCINNKQGRINRIKIFIDIIYCFYKFKMWSNQYLKENFHNLTKTDKQQIGKEYYQKGIIRDNWQKDFQQTRKFLIKYSNIKYEKSNLREKRNKAYAKKYNAGKNLMVENNVNISRQHYLNGNISIGENVLLAKNVFIDYSGNVIIKDNVRLTNGVIIETHEHDYHKDYRLPRTKITPSGLLIEEGVIVGSRAIILSSCNYIGKYARIGAGAVVTKNIPDYAVAVGVPAKIIKYSNQ